MQGHLELIFRDDVQRILDDFAACFKIRVVFLTPEGLEGRVGLNQPDSAYCRCIQSLYGEQSCLNLDEMKRREAAAKGEMICYECHAGLIEAMKPVIYEGRLLGYVVIGQFRASETMPERILADSVRGDCSQGLTRAFDALPIVPMDQIDHILGMFSMLVDYMVTQHMVSLRATPALEKMLAYMEEHLHEDISISDVADLIDRSRSTVHYLFTTYLGRSFKQTLVDFRLRRAEELMNANTGMKIKDVAIAVGYQDPLYFSRLFKKHRGTAPSKAMRP